MSSPTPNLVYTQGSGTASTDQFITVFSQIAPSPTDVNYPIGKRWINFANNKEYILRNLYSENSVVLANWEELTSGTQTAETLTGNSGGAVSADSNNNIFVEGDGSSINIVGNPGTNTLTANVILPSTANAVLYSDVSSIGGVTPGTVGQILTCQGLSNPPTWENAAVSAETLTPDSGAAVAPVSGTIEVTGYPTATTSAIKGIKTYNGGTNKFEIADMTQVTPYVVGKDANLYNFTTVQSAINAAVADGATAGAIKVVYVTAGIYTENLLMKSGVYLIGAVTSDQSSCVEIVGPSSFQSAVVTADLLVENIMFSNSGAPALSFGGDSPGLVTFKNVLVKGDYNQGVLFLGTNVFEVNFYNSTVSAITTGTCLGLSLGTINFYYCTFTSVAFNSEFSPTTTANFYYCDIQDSYSLVQAAINLHHCVVNSSSNVCIDATDSTVGLYYSSFVSNDAGGNFITGSGGTLSYTSIAAQGSAKKIDTGLTIAGNTSLVGNLSFDGGNTSLTADGQVWIGKTGGIPAAATLTAGSGIAITNAANSITISSTATAFAWSVQNANFTAAAGNGYLVTATANVTMPTSPNNGDTISFISGINTGSGQITLTPQVTRKISISNVLGSLGGTAVSTAYGNSLTLIYIAAQNTWFSTSVIGSWTVS